MTVKTLISFLNTLPSDAIVVYTPSRFIVDEITYDDFDNTVSFAGTREFNEAERDEPDYFPDNVNETNYDPYCGCDMFENDEVW